MAQPQIKVKNVDKSVNHKMPRLNLIFFNYSCPSLAAGQRHCGIPTRIRTGMMSLSEAEELLG